MRFPLPVHASLLLVAFVTMAAGAATLTGGGAMHELGAKEKTTLPPHGYKLVLDEDFKKLSLWNGKSGVWEPGFWHGGRYDSTSGELEYYVDPRPDHDLALVQAQKPFELTNHGLQIVARPMPAVERRLIANQTYTSGFLSTRRSVSLSYGYVEIRAEIPKGDGLWPAFWMLPKDDTWPPEIDVLEAIGGEGPQYWASVHFGPTEPNGREMNRVSAPALRDTFHDIGMLWSPDYLIWTYDGREVARDPTPANLKGKPMYLILCMAIGGKWAKPPTDPKTFPARLKIERVRMYSPGTASTTD